jgi:hypothetical protein
MERPRRWSHDGTVRLYNNMRKLYSRMFLFYILSLSVCVWTCVSRLVTDQKTKGDDNILFFSSFKGDPF